MILGGDIWVYATDFLRSITYLLIFPAEWTKWTMNRLLSAENVVVIIIFQDNYLKAF